MCFLCVGTGLDEKWSKDDMWHKKKKLKEWELIYSRAWQEVRREKGEKLSHKTAKQTKRTERFVKMEEFQKLDRRQSPHLDAKAGVNSSFP